MSRGDWQRPNCRNCSSDLNCENCPQKSSLRKISSFSLFIECWRLQFHRWLRQSDCRIHFRIKRVFEARAEKVRNRRHLSRGASGGRRRVASRPGCGNNTVRRLRSSTLDNYISRRSRATFCRLGRRYASSFGYTDRRLCQTPNYCKQCHGSRCRKSSCINRTSPFLKSVQKLLNVWFFGLKLGLTLLSGLT